MKSVRVSVVTVLLLLLIQGIAQSQGIGNRFKTTVVESHTLTITTNKTTNLIFPYAIKTVDRGSRDVLAQKAKGLENILLVKADRENFAETNLSVFTEDGTLYSFLLNYSSNPIVINLSLQRDTTSSHTGFSMSPEKEKVPIQALAEKVMGKKRMIVGVKDSKGKMRLRLNGLYIQGDDFFFQLEVENRSHIAYDIDLLRFFMRDEKKAKRTATQEIELEPLFVWGDTTAIKEQSKNTVIVALPKFTLPDEKNLHIQLQEKAGGRTLSIKVRNRTILKAKPVDE